MAERRASARVPSAAAAATSVVRRAAAGDHAAFTELVRSHRNFVFAVALAAVGDPDVAEDITQDAFLAAFRSLPTLKDPTALTAWLRRITRRQCARVLRRKRIPTEALDSADNHATELTDPPRLPDERRDMVIRALWRISATQREILALRYLDGMSQREIAALLGLPVTTVNNRMHAGRLALRRELLQNSTKVLRRSRLPARFAERVGTILRIRGPVIDVRFEFADLPDVLETLSVRDDAHKRDAVLEVVQRRGHGVVRCLVTPGEPVPARRAKHRGEEAAQDRDHARAAIAALRKTEARDTAFLETGIKAVDLLCPVCIGGNVAIVGDVGVGKLVLVQELVRRLTDLRGGIAVFTFVRMAERAWARSVAAAMEVRASAPDLTFFLAAAEGDEPQDPTDLHVDTLIYLARPQAERRIYPAIDPARSRSSLQTAAQAGTRHCATADAVRAALTRLSTESQLTADGAAGNDVLALRAWKLQLYLSQPLFVAEPFTRVEGTWVPRRDTLTVCREILDGRHDHVPPEAFWFVGRRPRDN